MAIAIYYAIFFFKVLCYELFTKQALSILCQTQNWKQSIYKLLFPLGQAYVLRWTDAGIDIRTSLFNCGRTIATAERWTRGLDWTTSERCQTKADRGLARGGEGRNGIWWMSCSVRRFETGSKAWVSVRINCGPPESFPQKVLACVWRMGTRWDRWTVARAQRETGRRIDMSSSI